MMAAQEIIELFSELIAVRLPIIEAQRKCPLDLKEAISTRFWCHRKLVELLSVRAPSPETKLKLLKEIAQEHQLDWDPTPTETDLFKSHEDLLDGPKQFGGGSKVPLKEEQDKGSHLTMLSLSRPEEQRQSGSDSEDEELDFPEVPNVLLRPNPAATYEHTSPNLPLDSENAGDDNLASKRDEHTAKASSTVVESDREKQSSYSPPSVVGVVGSFSTNESDAPRKISDVDLRDVLTAAQAAADSAERAAAAARSAASLAQLRINELTKKTPDQSPESPTENPFYSTPPQQTMEKTTI
ncbi:Regulator of Vps4 activity in the MVB pathway protein [Raphanus sativus]|nr:Regulator of Vps4 activity in the MVB pathway protein [Raphanus sativus]